MQPEPCTVADTVRALVDDDWPRSEAERAALFRKHRIEPTRPLENWPCWGGGIEGWGDTTSCWSRDGEDFVGVGWFLWADAPGALDAARELERLLVAAFGEGIARENGSELHWTEWTAGEAVVEMAIGPAEDPQVQVHIVHAEHASDDTLAECKPTATCCLPASG